MANLPTPAVVLCACHGRVAGRLPLDCVGQFLKEIAPDTQVVVSDDLCQRQSICSLRQQLGTKPLVLGACSQLKHTRYFWEDSDNAFGLSYSSAIVDLLAEASAPFDGEAVAERAKLLLWSQVRRLSAFRGVGQDNLKLRFAVSRAKVSRRQFLAAALPKYELIPCIDQSRCCGADKCGLCQDGCPTNAVATEQEMAVIDKDKCSGCGACVALCPHDAVYYPAFLLEELDNELEGLLFHQGNVLEPRIMALVCETCSSRFDGDNESPITYPASVLPLRIPCLAMASPWLMLRAFDMGCQGLVLISDKEKCHRGASAAMWQKNVEFVKALLASWNIGAERVRLFQVSKESITNVESGLVRFADEVHLLGSTRFKWGEPTHIPGNALRLTELIKGMGRKLGCSFSGGVSAGAVPFGKLTLDSSGCTGCGLCAVNCPTDALSMGTGEGKADYQLLFKQDACVGCGRCAGVCPEKCLRLQRVLELDRIYAGASELFHDDMLSCRRCGEPVAPMSMILHLKERVRNSGSGLLEQLELCNRCKREVQRNRVGGKGDSLRAEARVPYSTHDRAGQDRSE